MKNCYHLIGLTWTSQNQKVNRTECWSSGLLKYKHHHSNTPLLRSLGKKFIVWILIVSGFLIYNTVLHAQYAINEKIEAEDLYDDRVPIPQQLDGQQNRDWLRVGHGEGWVNHSSNFIYALCGNRHWLCDYRTVPRCQYVCADVYVSAPITIPEDGDYIIYAYIAAWSDSAVIQGNRGCNRNDKWECCGWFVAWDDAGLLDKVQDQNGNWNVPKDYLWKIYPHNTFCDTFALDTVSLGHDRIDCPGGDPREYDFPGTRFPLTSGEHTLYLKVAEEYTLLDWIWIAKDGDPPPVPEPGRSWQTKVEKRIDYRPEGFVLKQNYPNPFNSETIIHYFLLRSALVKLAVYNIEGREVTVLVNSIQSRGQHLVYFNASNLPSGTYLYKLQASCTTCGGKSRTLFSDSKEMVVVR